MTVLRGDTFMKCHAACLLVQRKKHLLSTKRSSIYGVLSGNGEQLLGWKRRAKKLSPAPLARWGSCGKHEFRNKHVAQQRQRYSLASSNLLYVDPSTVW